MRTRSPEGSSGVWPEPSLAAHRRRHRWAAAGRGGSPHPHHRLAIFVIAAAQLMVMLDLTIVNIALPSIQRELLFSTSGLTWVIDAYVLVFGGLLLLGGRSGDLFGRRRMFTVGIALFAAASLAGGLSSDQASLIAARAIQGAGAAIASPTALSLIASTFSEGYERNRAMAIYAAMSAAGGATGLILGGVLVDFASWRWVLFVNVPIGAFVLALTPIALPASGTMERRAGYLDLPGAATISAGAALLVYGLVRAPENGWASAQTLAALGLATTLIAAFIQVERRSPQPLVPPQFLANRRRAVGYSIMLLVGAAMLSLIFFLTQFLQEVPHYSPILAGIAYLPIPVMVATTSAVVSRLVKRFGTRPFLTLGPLFISIGLYLVSFLKSTSGYGEIFGPLVLAGFGMGLSFVPLTLNAVSSVDRANTGLASALLNTSQQIGGSVGLAALVTIAATATRRFLNSASARPASGTLAHAIGLQAMVHGYDLALRSGAIAAALAVIMSMFLPRRHAQPTVHANEPVLEKIPLQLPAEADLPE
jgi:EmrB/QacA subfamily drug resistance transporter